MLLEVIIPLPLKPFAWSLVALTAATVLFPRQKHAIRKLIPVYVSVAKQVLSTRLRIGDLDLAEEALREYMVDLRKAVLVGRDIVEVLVPEIENDVDQVRTVPHLPESV